MYIYIGLWNEGKLSVPLKFYCSELDTFNINLNMNIDFLLDHWKFWVKLLIYINKKINFVYSNKSHCINTFTNQKICITTSQKQWRNFLKFQREQFFSTFLIYTSNNPKKKNLPHVTICWKIKVAPTIQWLECCFWAILGPNQSEPNPFSK